jgi:uncharacterized protein (TIGR02145 family)
LCYNLGADQNKSIAEQTTYSPSPSGIASTDATVYGHLYQWGRVADGHQERTSTAVAGPVPDGSLDGNGQVLSTATTYYSKHVYNMYSPYDWRSRNDTLWGATKTANDPCPSGWRVPTITEWHSIFNGVSNPITTVTGGDYTSSSGNRWVWQASGTGGYKISPDGAGSTNYTLFLPAAGGRNATGSNPANGAGGYGYYWSSTPNGTNSHYLFFTSTNMYLRDLNYRACGYNVRCVAE